MESQLDEAVCTLYATVSWTMTTGELLAKEADESGYGSITVPNKGIYFNENQNNIGEASSLETGWPYTSGHYKNGAIGLYNMGLTCCLNSLLQTLYMNREFTDILQGLDMPEDAAALEDNVPFQLLILFEEMQCSRQSAVFPYRLIHCLRKHGLKWAESSIDGPLPPRKPCLQSVRGSSEGRQAEEDFRNVFIQQDAAELFMTIWNLIIDQIAISQPPLAERLSLLYTIHVQEYGTCLKCLRERTSDSNLIALPLPLSDPRFKRPTSLEEALVCFFQPTQLTEENMCFCQDCGEKTTRLQGMRLKTMPQTLTLHLKRLHYGKTSWVQKISRKISFPLSLDVNKVVSSDCVGCDNGQQAQWQYELFSVVAHCGTPSFGHYCSYIRSFKDQRWYCFNDSSVSEVSWDDVKCTFGSSRFHWGETAYLLVYMKAESK